MKRDFTYKCVKRTGCILLRETFPELRSIIQRAKQRNLALEFIQNRLFEALQNNKIWRKLLGLLSKLREGLNRFSPKELNKHFAAVVITNYKLGLARAAPLSPPRLRQDLNSIQSL